jgi:hypothetical protein
MNIICTTSGSVDTCDYSALAPQIWLIEFFILSALFFGFMFFIFYIGKKLL